MPTPNLFLGHAPALERILHLVPASVETGAKFKVTINGKTVSYTAAANTVADVTAGLAAALAASEIPEFAEVDWSDATTHVVGTGPEGQSWDCSTSTEASTLGNLTIVETTPGVEAVNEVQRFKLQDGASGGTWTYTNDFGSGNETSAAIAYNASAATVKAAIEGMTTPVAGDCSVVKNADGDWFVTWTGNFAGTEVAEGTIDGSSLTGTGDADVEDAQAGRGNSDEVQMVWIKTDSSASSFSCALSFNGNKSAALTEDETAATLQTKLEAVTGIGSGNVEVYGGRLGTNLTPPAADQLYAIHFTGDLAGSNLAALVGTDLVGCEVVVETVHAGGESTRDEVQSVYFGASDGGDSSSALAFEGETTGTISTATQPSDAETELEALAGLDDVEVFGAPGHLIVRFKGSDADTDVSLLQHNGLGNVGVEVEISEVMQGQASQNQIWNIRIFASGGTFTLSDGTDTTSAITFGALASTVKTRLETDITAITTVTASGTGTPDDPYVVELTDPAGTPLTLTGDGSSLTGGDGLITEETAHAAGTNEVQTVTIDAAVTGGTFTLSFENAETAGIAYNAAAATVQTALEGLLTIGSSNVSVTGSAGGPYTVTFQGDLAATDVELLVGDGSSLTGAAGSQTLSITESQRDSGPNHWSAAANWSLGHVCEYDETPVFEEGNEPLQYHIDQVRDFTADNATEQLTIAWHPFVDEQKVRLRNSGGALPTGLSTGTDYYVIVVDQDTIQLSATRGGSAVTFSDDGTGTHTVGVGVDDFEHYSRSNSEIGLAYRTDSGYVEYRPRKLKLWMETTAGSPAKAVRIGEGDGASAPRILLDFGTDEIHSVTFNTGSSNDGTPALQINNKNAASTHLLIEGEFGMAVERTDDEQFDTLTQRGGTLFLGQGLVTGDIVKTGGSIQTQRTTINGDLSIAL